tara:strand:+ start:210691 stop:212583 length:1893 start_codon:yes stop_codon:yes gene_type:complete
VLAAGAAAAMASSSATQQANADFALVRSLPLITKRAISYDSVTKKRAIADYRHNMRPFGGSLSKHGRHLLHQPQRFNAPWDFDVVIVGSGYGASICAARLSMAMGCQGRLAVIERGREWIPGTYGDTLRGVTGESRFQLFGNDKNSVDNPVGLVSAMRNDEVNVLSGNGLGGSSLINANVAIRPDRDCFSQKNWPARLRDRSVLDPYYDIASWELGVSVEPPDISPKSRAQRLAARNLAGCGAHFQRAALTVTRPIDDCDGPIVNRQGIRQRGCTGCGDCTSGCNVGAKNTLAMNYLPLARQHGAEIYTHTEVVRVEKVDSYYRIHFKNFIPLPDGEFRTVCGSVTSRVVILGAGSIGSNEIMLRSRGCGMELSDRVGYQWTMNGDALGFVRKSRYLVNSGGVSAYRIHGHPVGPTIQTNVTYPNRPSLRDRVLIQDGSVSRAYATVLGGLMGDLDLDRTMVLLGMGHDGSGGRVTLRGDGMGEVKWKGIKESPYRKHIRGEFARIAKGHGGKYKYLKIFGDNFITVHPLGGCALADDPACGVVNDFGQVFDGSQGGMVDAISNEAAVHRGFYVADGAVIPSAIACNPLLTISAIAERIAENIVANPEYADLFGQTAPMLGSAVQRSAAS